MTTRDRRRAASSWKAVVCMLVIGALCSACAPDQIVAPSIPASSPPSQFKPLAFTADIDAKAGRIVITAPSGATSNAPTLSLDGAERPSLSLLGGEVIRLVPLNYQASEIGAYAPNKIRVTFDVVIENKLPAVALTTPTWPAPPASGVILFPIDYVVTTTPGDVVGGTGNDVLVEVSGGGAVVPSVEWNGTGAVGSGSPYNFFNDNTCALATSNDCFRWKAYAAPIQPLSSSAPKTVGFDIDASVGQFRARLVVAADLASAVTIAPGTISGTVTSPIRGPLRGIIVSVGAGLLASTDSNGGYSLAGVSAGNVNIVVSNLPTDCVTPSAQPTQVVPGATTIANMSLTCSGLAGTISGTLTSSVGGPPIPGAIVTASTGGSAMTSATGAYSIRDAGAGSGTITFSNLFAGCGANAQAYLLASAGATTADAVASCPTPPGPGYQYSTTWFDGGSGRVEVELRIDMRTFNRADIADTTTGGITGDPLRSIQVRVEFDTTLLRIDNIVEATEGRSLNLVATGVDGAGRVDLIAAAGAGGRTGNLGIARITFTRTPGAAAGTFVTIVTTSIVASSSSNVPIQDDIVRIEGGYALPP